MHILYTSATYMYMYVCTWTCVHARSVTVHVHVPPGDPTYMYNVHVNVYTGTVSPLEQLTCKALSQFPCLEFRVQTCNLLHQNCATAGNTYKYIHVHNSMQLTCMHVHVHNSYVHIICTEQYASDSPAEACWWNEFVHRLELATQLVQRSNQQGTV